MVPWKLFWIVVGGIDTLAAGVLPLPQVLDLGMVIPIAATAPLVIVAIVVTHLGVEYAVMFADLGDVQRGNIKALIVVAILVHAAWLVTLQVQPGWLLWWPLVLLFAASGEYVTAAGYEYLQAAKARRRGVTHGGPDADRPLDNTEKTFSAALERSGLGSLTIVGCEELCDGNGN